MANNLDQQYRRIAQVSDAIRPSGETQIRRGALKNTGGIQSTPEAAAPPEYAGSPAGIPTGSAGYSGGGFSPAGGTSGNLYAGVLRGYSAPYGGGGLYSGGMRAGNGGIGSRSGSGASGGNAGILPIGTTPTEMPGLDMASGSPEAPAQPTGNVTYVDENGQKKTGTADTSAPGYFDSMRQYYEDMYNSQAAANQAALEKAEQRAREAAQAQQEALDEQYEGVNRQLYRDYMEHRRTLPQEMAARGYNGGLTESGNIRLRNAYEEALAENERARLSQRGQYDANLSQQLYEAQAAADKANQQAAQERYSYLAALLEAENQQKRADEERDRQRLEDRAAMLGTAGDFNAYLELGYSQAEVDAMTRAWLAQNPGLLNAWLKSHPADASRLGITSPGAAASSGGGRTYGGSSGGGTRTPGGAWDKSAGQRSTGHNTNPHGVTKYQATI